MKRLLNSRTLVAAIFVIALVAVVAVSLFIRRMNHRQDERFTSSCANHAIQLKFDVMQFCQKAERFPLESDARSAFMHISLEDGGTADWLDSAASACPESYQRDNSMGYVFVADGLSTKTARDHSALVFFCPADSHQRSSEHCHALMGGGELACVKSNSEMISQIGRAHV